jgi:hypothetical protein
MRRHARLVFAFLAAACTGCVVYPRQVSTYDAHCGATAQRLELDAVLLLDCESTGDNEACLIAIVGVGAATTVISSSIVIVGNIVFSLREQDACTAKARA